MASAEYREENSETFRRKVVGPALEYGGFGVGLIELLGGAGGAAIVAGMIGLIGLWVRYNGTDSRKG